MGTFRDRAIGRGFEHFQQLGIVVLAMAACTTEANALAWQGAGHECCLPFAHDTFRIMSQSGNGGDFFDVRDDPAAPQAGFSQACRNSAKCG
jgi:hypothetical protein